MRTALALQKIFDADARMHKRVLYETILALRMHSVRWKRFPI